MSSPLPSERRQAALELGPLLAAGFLAVLLGSELTACALALAWSVGATMHLGLLATEIGTGILLAPVLWTSVAVFRRALQVERRLAAAGSRADRGIRPDGAG